MRRLVWLGLIVVLMLSIGCAHGRTTYYPTPKCDSGCADVVVIRKVYSFGGGAPISVSLNGFPIAFLNIGEYIKFRLPVGINAIGIEMYGKQTGSITIPFEDQRGYYFLIDSSLATFSTHISRVEKLDAKKYLADPEYKELDQNEKADAKEWR